MSLAVLADHMASKGRGPDSMLIHMSPREVQGLQALAMSRGGSLTINPDTGLPEAGFLDKLLPTIIGAGLTFFGGVPPNVAAMIVGGIQTVRTGDLGKGIQAGLGAYGGANLTAGLTEAGASTIGAAEAAKGLTMSPELVAEFGGDLEKGISAKDALLQQQVTDRMASATPYEKLSSGFDAFKNNPMDMAKSLAMPAAMAFGPAILAGANVKQNMPQTVTKPGMIRPYSYDPYGGTYTAGSPYEATPKSAAEGGLMGMNNGGYSPGQLDFTQQSEPVMRMAEGGIAGYAPGGYVPSDTEIFNYFKTPGGKTDAQIATDMQKFGVSAADIARATGTQNQQADYEKRFVNTLNTGATDANEFLAATKAVGLQGQGLTNAMQGAGLSQGAQYALTHALDDKTLTNGVTDAVTGKPVNLYSQIGYTAGALPGDQGGLEGLYSNINYTATGLQNLINKGTMSVADAQNAALAELARTGVSVADVKAATGKDFGNLFTAKPLTCGPGFELNAAGTACVPIKVIDKKVIDKTCAAGYHFDEATQQCVKDIIEWKECATGYHWDKAQQACVPNINSTQNTTTTVTTPTSLVTTPATTLPVGVSGNTGASIIGGGSTVNPNGTITTSPVIPDIPVGGFTGMTNLRDTYEKGGGSLGVNKNLFVPKTQDELLARYKNTGGSKAAFDYLMGKTPYSPVPVTPTGEIMKPYWESVGRAPINLKVKKYIFKDGKYELNPDYVKPSYVQAGEKAAALTNQDKEPIENPGAGNKWTWNSTDKKWEAKPIGGDTTGTTASENDRRESGGAAGGGLMATGGLAALTMAGGGSPEQFNLGGYSDGGRLLRGPGDGVSDSIPATIGNKRPARLADGEFVVPARIVSELGNGSTEAGARKLYAMMDRVQAARKGSIGKGKVAKNSRADKYLPA